MKHSSLVIIYYTEFASLAPWKIIWLVTYSYTSGKFISYYILWKIWNKLIYFHGKLHNDVEISRIQIYFILKITAYFIRLQTEPNNSYWTTPALLLLQQAKLYEITFGLSLKLIHFQNSKMLHLMGTSGIEKSMLFCYACSTSQPYRDMKFKGL